MEFNQNHKFYPNKEAEDDDGEEVIWRAQRELDDWVEEGRNLDKTAYCNGYNQLVKIFNQKYVFVLRKIVFMLLETVHQCICATSSNITKFMVFGT